MLDSTEQHCASLASVTEEEEGKKEDEEEADGRSEAKQDNETLIQGKMSNYPPVTYKVPPSGKQMMPSLVRPTELDHKKKKKVCFPHKFASKGRRNSNIFTLIT